MGHWNCGVCGHDKCICEKGDIKIDVSGNPKYVAQEGGDHYQSQYQHWDWVIDIKLGYLEGNATKYISRWKDKNGLQDLNKARTYLVKMSLNIEKLDPRPFDISYEDCTGRFIKENDVEPIEAEICRTLAFWKNRTDLMIAFNLLDALIAKVGKTQGLPAGGGAAPAPTQAPPTPARATLAPPSAAVAQLHGAGGTSGSTGVAGNSPEGMKHPLGYDDDDGA